MLLKLFNVKKHKIYLSYALSGLILTVLGVSTLPAYSQTFDESMTAVRNAYEKYNFSEAVRHLANARKKMRSDIPSEKGEVEMYERQISLAKNFINRVEKIEILDSISVPKTDFFKAYRLPSSAGYLEGQEGLPVKVEDVEYVFSNEDGDFKIWAEQDTTGFYNIAESIRLTDGSWSKPVMAPPALGGGGNAEFPFMMPDGVTLYFASDGEGSIGGYDIFVATRDAQSGEYLQPQNLGMPYNSPFDDYLLAIDEYNGVGWWATDRNKLGDNLTVYLYKVKDTRVNYNPDEEDADIEDLALITNFKATQDEEKDYSSLVSQIKEISPAKKRKELFRLPLSGGRVYVSFDDFTTVGGREAMKNYLLAKREYDLAARDLSDLRKQYHSNPSPELKSKIRLIESQMEKDNDNLKNLLNDVYKAEGN